MMVGHLIMMMEIYHNLFSLRYNRHCRRLFLSHAAVDQTPLLSAKTVSPLSRNDPCADVQFVWWSTLSTANVVNNKVFSCGGKTASSHRTAAQCCFLFQMTFGALCRTTQAFPRGLLCQLPLLSWFS